MSEPPVDPALASVAETLEPSLVRRGLWILVGALIVAVAVLGLTWGVSLWSVGFAVVAWLSGGKLLSLGLRGVPLLEWDSEGITDRTSLIGGDLFIPWSDISSVTTNALHSGIRLNFVPNAESASISGPGRWLQARINQLRGFSGIEISPSFMAIDYRSLGRSFDEMVTQRQVGEVAEYRSISGPGSGDPDGSHASSL